MRIGNQLISFMPRTTTGSRYGNLAPLAHDTVSFSGRGKSVKDVPRAEKSVSKSESKQFDNSERAAIKLAQSLYNESEYAFAQLKFKLDNIFGESLIDIDSPGAADKLSRAYDANKNKPVVFIAGRRKKPESISEKMATKHIRSKAGVKEELNDMIGARIIISGTSTKEGDYVIGKLTDAVKKNHLKINSVKLHGQEYSKLNYATRSKLNKLVETSRKHGSPLCTYTDTPRDTGYLAIHLGTDVIEDGYRAEIQIMGVDVEKFKDIEDLAYKCMAGKAIPKKYEPIKALFESINDNKKAKSDYARYAKMAYAYERLKPIHERGKYNGHLDLPKDLYLPEKLDFNNIAKMKKQIDNEKNRQG